MCMCVCVEGVVTPGVLGLVTTSHTSELCMEGPSRTSRTQAGSTGTPDSAPQPSMHTRMVHEPYRLTLTRGD